jgi:hemerythrin superfamily protein
MPDATELLSRDHREVERLFDRYTQSKDPEVVRQICTELTVHAAIEEKVLYPALGTSVSGGKGLREHAEHEHQQVKNAIFEIERVGYTDPQVDAHMRTIIEGVREHVAEEEGEVFPKLSAELGKERLEQLGAELAQLKAELMPQAEQAGPLIDLTKDKLYELAQEKGVAGRSDMTKEELILALRAP